MLKRSWVEIDLSQLEKNYYTYRSILSDNCRIMAVVKADAYGHGDCQIAKRLSALGVTDFAVASVDEAYKLRECGIEGEILVLGYTPVEYASVLFEKDLVQTIISEQYAEELCKINLPIKCNIALDTGMNRIGLHAENISECVRVIRTVNEKLQLTGLFTHLCVADSDKEKDIRFTRVQIERYNKVEQAVSDLNLCYNHCLNSAGGLWHGAKYQDLVRLGIVLYGLKPDNNNVLPEGIKPIMQWKSVVSMVKWVERGETVGYGRSYIATKRVKIATVSTGYADGYSRKLSNKGTVLINGKKAPITGRVCMDQFMVDVTDIDNVVMGTEVVLVGCRGDAEYTADDMAQDIGTIGYEVVCNIGSRVLRIYM